MKTSRQLREQVNETIITALRTGKIPWHSAYGFPRNILSRRRFDGLSGLLLMVVGERHGFSSCFWGTRREWETLGGEIMERPGTQVVVPAWFSSLRPCTVYNLCQIVGEFPVSRSRPRTVDYRSVEKVIGNTRAVICYTVERIAEYIYPGRGEGGRGDYINMVRMEHFVRSGAGINAYYHCIFHELVGHWTEPGARVGWWGDDAAAELRAEMASDFMATELGIPSFPYENRKHHHDHIDVWVRRLIQDPKLVFKVARSAALAVDYVLRFTSPVKPRHRLTCDGPE
jgi:antirestriction protein ArdC